MTKSWMPRETAVDALVTKARKHAGVSMRELARRSGLSAGQVSRIESGGVTPSKETLAKLAYALERRPQPLYIAADHFDGAESLELVRAMLKALPSGAADDLAEASHELDKLEAGLDRLETERQDSERAYRVASARHLDLAEDLSRVQDEANQALVPERESDDADRVAGSGGRADLEAMIGRDLLVAEDEEEEAFNRVRAVERLADVARDALERRVREVAARLFDLDTPERLERVRAPADSGSAQGGDVSVESGVVLNPGGRVEQGGSTTARYAIESELDAIVRAWPELTNDRRRRVFAYVEDQRRLSAQESASKHREEGGDVAMPSEDEPE